jgi:hypothetical protein
VDRELLFPIHRLGSFCSSSIGIPEALDTKGSETYSSKP